MDKLVNLSMCFKCGSARKSPFQFLIYVACLFARENKANYWLPDALILPDRRLQWLAMMWRKPGEKLNRRKIVARDRPHG